MLDIKYVSFGNTIEIKLTINVLKPGTGVTEQAPTPYFIRRAHCGRKTSSPLQIPSTSQAESETRPPPSH
jgi:hypothetical protein